MAEINSSRVSTSKALTNVIQQNMMNMKVFFFFCFLANVFFLYYLKMIELQKVKSPFTRKVKKIIQ